jgi:hypothetical protein
LLSLNPEVVKILRRKEEGEYNKLKFKKEAKLLQAQNMEAEMKIKERSIYRQHVKYPY